jgi:predicted  nucleic acid-binding Zn-ribbon protein
MTTPQRPFGIERAIELMRSLPTAENPALVALTIARTLTAVDTNVSEIIDDATSRQQDLETKLAKLRASCDALETEIELGVDEIVKLEAFLAEVASVLERLELVHDAPDPSVATAGK